MGDKIQYSKLSSDAHPTFLNGVNGSRSLDLRFHNENESIFKLAKSNEMIEIDFVNNFEVIKSDSSNTFYELNDLTSKVELKIEPFVNVTYDTIATEIEFLSPGKKRFTSGELNIYSHLSESTVDDDNSLLTTQWIQGISNLSAYDDMFNEYLRRFSNDRLDKNMIKRFSKIENFLMSPSQEEITFSAERALSDEMAYYNSPTNSVSEISYRMFGKKNSNKVLRFMDNIDDDIETLETYPQNSAHTDDNNKNRDLFNIFQCVADKQIDEILSTIPIPFSMIRAIRLTRIKKLSKKYCSMKAPIQQLLFKRNKYNKINHQSYFLSAKSLIYDLTLRYHSSGSVMTDSTLSKQLAAKTSQINQTWIMEHNLHKQMAMKQFLTVPLRQSLRRTTCLYIC